MGHTPALIYAYLLAYGLALWGVVRGASRGGISGESERTIPGALSARSAGIIVGLLRISGLPPLLGFYLKVALVVELLGASG